MISSILLVGIAVVIAAPNRPIPCQVSSLPTPQVLVDEATLIIHARAEGLADVAGTTESLLIRTQAQVRFRVLSVVKGKFTGVELAFNGLIAPDDDWNDRPVPYDFIRPGGRAGNCFALRYKRGGEYLLLLRPVDPKATTVRWSPYWAALSPTNEQVRGASDPWLTWVAKQIKE